MLFKLSLDPALTPAMRGTTSNSAVWVVDDTVPLNAPSNISAFCVALGFPANHSTTSSTFRFASYRLTTVQGTSTISVDWQKTAKAQGFANGVMVHCGTALGSASSIAASSSSMRSPREGAPNSPGRRPASPPSSPRGTDRVRAVSMAPSVADEDETGADPTEDEEIYHSHAIGWMPFAVTAVTQGASGPPPQPAAASSSSPPSSLAATQSGGGGGGLRYAVTYVDATTPIGDTDRAPPRKELCKECVATALAADALRVAVDRHYRPTRNVVTPPEGWVEKLGGSTFPRWQKRYLVLSEQSLDWFTEKPSTAEKTKITGHRPFVRDGEFLLAEVVDANIDHPKCKEDGWFPFKVVFKDNQAGDKDMYFRVQTAKERTLFVNFLRLSTTRMRSKSLSRNPVYWKRWCDALLANTADVAMLHRANERGATETEAEIERLRAKLAALQMKRPELEQSTQEKAIVVKSLLAQVGERQGVLQSIEVQKGQTRQVVEKERALLAQAELDFGEELKKQVLLEDYAKAQLAEVTKQKDALLIELEDLKEKHQIVFSKWRKLEETQDGEFTRSANGRAALQSVGSGSSSAAAASESGGRTRPPHLSFSPSGAPPPPVGGTSSTTTPSRLSHSGKRDTPSSANNSTKRSLHHDSTMMKHTSPSPLATGGGAAAPSSLSPRHHSVATTATTDEIVKQELREAVNRAREAMRESQSKC